MPLLYSAEDFLDELPDTACDICYEAFNAADHVLVVLPCKHMFDLSLPLLASPHGVSFLQTAQKNADLLKDATALWKALLDHPKQHYLFLDLVSTLQVVLRRLWLEEGYRSSKARSDITTRWLRKVFGKFLEEEERFYLDGLFGEVDKKFSRRREGNNVVYLYKNHLKHVAPRVETEEQARHAAVIWQFFKCAELFIKLCPLSADNSYRAKAFPQMQRCVLEIVANLRPHSPISQLALLSVLLLQLPIATMKKDFRGGDLLEMDDVASKRWNAICEYVLPKLRRETEATVTVHAVHTFGPCTPSPKIYYTPQPHNSTPQCR
ncbi:hypothetical protein BU23DRAFT_594582 [Bimuria novae-zelandiae CBS 107.79]|uniref:Uncharacterized protein n=1 Tax=Bimuria novae-zelandiae CBS 107.79 TaxID=1447943 RepID=A0A6A5VUS5_9PLEO|nr:hypothetical protein BU23DRAFT_594582 [Bimuria novae-zelandiae CBS 107.79]